MKRSTVHVGLGFGMIQGHAKSLSSLRLDTCDTYGAGPKSIKNVAFSGLACVASVSVQFGSKELQGNEWSE